jgi:integrase
VAATTANLRLAALSSFYSYALAQDFLRGANPIARVARRKVLAYAGARPLAYESLRASLTAIDRSTPAGRRDYALLLVGLHTGRRLSELAAMRREHLTIRGTSVEIIWPRCKGGKTMRIVLPRGGRERAAGEALVSWVRTLYGDLGARPGTASSERDDLFDAGRSQALIAASGRTDRPLWISLAGNGSFGHALNKSSLADLCEKRVGTRQVHALRHTFARALEDGGAKVSEIQAQLGHESLATTGRYLARLHQGESRHHAQLAILYGLDAPLAAEAAAATGSSEGSADD